MSADSPALLALQSWLAESTGLEAALLGPRQLERAVAQRCQLRDLTDAERYATLLRRDAQEQQELLERLLVGESWFLREPQAFAQLVVHMRQQRERPLRVLSCGCASGEEPYSIVIALVEAGWRREQLQVEAIDLSERALARAAEGVYGRHALRGLDAPALARHFEPSGERWRLRAALRGAVRFHHGSLLQRLAELPRGWHALFCRNVMLYLQPQARAQLLALIAERLAPGGLLQVAIAEAPMVPLGLFQRQPGTHGASFYLREMQGLSPQQELQPPAARPVVAPPAPPVTPVAGAPSASPLEPAVHLAGARQLQARGQSLEALEALRRCLYLDPDHLEALELRLQLARELGLRRDIERQQQRLERARRRRSG